MRHWITSFQFVADGLNYDRMPPAPQARKQSRIGQSHEGASMAVRAAKEDFNTEFDEKQSHRETAMRFARSAMEAFSVALRGFASRRTP
jgi:hypothetical protein